VDRTFILIDLTNIGSYFFECLTRPSVAIRLIARDWTASRVTVLLNESRIIDPPYLSNTTSHKLRTAKRLAGDTFGEGTVEYLTEQFKIADDERATQLCMIQPEENLEPTDCNLLSLCRGLRTNAQGRAGGSGMLTECIDFCRENIISWPLSKVEDLHEWKDSYSVDQMREMGEELIIGWC
jgi:hypothetical protein